MSDRPQFDYDKAGKLIDQLSSAIRVLNDQTNLRVTTARDMQDPKNPKWTGHHADQFFGTEMPRIKKQADDLVTRMQNVRSAVQGAYDAALYFERQWEKQQPQLTPTTMPGPAPSPPPPVSSTPAPTTGPTPTPPPTPGG